MIDGTLLRLIPNGWGSRIAPTPEAHPLVPQGLLIGCHAVRLVPVFDGPERWSQDEVLRICLPPLNRHGAVNHRKGERTTRAGGEQCALSEPH